MYTAPTAIPINVQVISTSLCRRVEGNPERGGGHRPHGHQRSVDLPTIGVFPGRRHIRVQTNAGTVSTGTDDGGAVWCPWWSMTEPEPASNPTPTPHDQAPALEAARMLVELALRYWSEDRPEEALRVARQAVAALATAPVDHPARGEAEAALRGIEEELSQR